MEANAHCVLATGTNSYRSGIDVVVEGTAGRVSDHDTLARLAAMWKDRLDWVFAVGDGRLPRHRLPRDIRLVFAVTPSKILAFSNAPYSQTRYVS
jgi:hypothetical protein